MAVPSLGDPNARGVWGFGAALGGAWAQQLLSRQWGFILGPLLIVLGLLWTGWLKIPLPWLPMRGKRAATLVGRFCPWYVVHRRDLPCVLAGLVGRARVSASIGSVIYGGLLWWLADAGFRHRTKSFHWP